MRVMYVCSGVVTPNLLLTTTNLIYKVCSFAKNARAECALLSAQKWATDDAVTARR